MFRSYMRPKWQKTRFCDSDVLKNVLKFQIFSVLKIKILCAQACLFSWVCDVDFLFVDSHNTFHMLHRFTCVLGFNKVLTELNDIAGQRETVAEKLTSSVMSTLQSSIHDIKQERKKVWSTYFAYFCK